MAIRIALAVFALLVAAVRAAPPVLTGVLPADGEAVRRELLTIRATDADADLSRMTLTVSDPAANPFFSLAFGTNNASLVGLVRTNRIDRDDGITAVRFVGNGATGAWHVAINTAHPAWQKRLAHATLGDFQFAIAVEDAAAGSVATNFTLGVQNAAAFDFNGDGASDLALQLGMTGRIQVNASVPGESNPQNWTDVWATSKGNVNWVPAPGDYDGDGMTDPAWYIPAQGKWRIYLSSRGLTPRTPLIAFGGPQDVPLPADIDGDGRTDLVLLQPDGRIRVCTGEAWDMPGNPAWLPAPGDYDGDGKADPAWFGADNGRWHIFLSSSNYVEWLPRSRFGAPGDRPVRGDFDGDGKADRAVFVASNGCIRVSLSGGGEWTSPAGFPGGLPAVADYDGDGRADPAWFMPKTLAWRIHGSAGGYVEWVPRLVFGAAGATPLPADFDGDGKADLAVRLADGRIQVRESGSSNVWTSVQGQAAWRAAPADYDGDGRADLAWFVPGSGKWRVFESAAGGVERGQRTPYGNADDLPIPADYDGDGKADLAVFSPLSGRIGICTGWTWVSPVGGATGWLPALADYDGDGKADYAWYLPATRTWRIYDSASGYAQRPDAVFGAAGDRPVPADFDGDGKADLALYATNGTIRVKESSGGAVWTTPEPAGVDVSRPPVWLPAPADYNGDGRADAAWYRAQDGSGTFRVVYSDGDNTDDNAGAGQRVTSRVLGGLTDRPLAGLPFDLPRQLRYFVIPHPDDEEESWTLAADPGAYTVFILCTRGEAATVCAAGDTWRQPDEYKPVGADCVAKRLDSWNRFIDASLEPAQPIGDYGDVRVWRGPHHARLAFSFPDGGLQMPEVTDAVLRTRGWRGSLLPALTEGDVVAGGYFSDSYSDCLPYTHVDHGTIAYTVYITDFGLPRYVRTCGLDPRVNLSLALSGAVYQRAIANFLYFYGWQHPGHWDEPYWICPDNCLFSQYQDYIWIP